MPSPSSASIESTLAELMVIGDLLERQRDRLAGLAVPFLGTDRDDVAISIHEAERQLLMTTRSLQRAARSIGH